MLPLVIIAFVLLWFLWSSHRQLERRLGELEGRLDHLRWSLPREPVPEPEPIAPRAAPERIAPAERTEIEPPAPAAAELAEPEHDAPEPLQESLAGLFERFVGGRLLIWVGGIALAVAGVFLVRYSIEIGLITPPVRMIMAALFGFLLIGAGEFARSRGGADQRIAQSLVGAGIFVLYAATYGSLTLYGLISVGTASALMAAITAAALALALRHGVPTAVMGLTGGFLTPLLVGDPDAGAVPLLIYLALLNAALFALAQRRGWSWLAALAVVLTFLWTAALIFSGADDALAAGLFVLAMGILASLASPGPGRELRLVQPAGIALLQLAILVARGDIGAPAWALFGTLAAASLALSLRAGYRLLSAAALLLALVLIAVRSAVAADPSIPLAAALTTLMFGGFAAWRLMRREPEPELPAALAGAAFAGPALLLRLGEPELLVRPLWGLLFATLAAAAAFLGWIRRSAGKEDAGGPLLLLSATGAALLMAAAHDLVPREWLAAAWLVVAAAAALWSRALSSRALALLPIFIAVVALCLALVQLGPLWSAVASSLAGIPALVPDLPPALAALRLLLVPAAALMLVRHLLDGAEPRLRRGLGIAAIVLGLFGAYLLFKQAWGLADQREFVARGFAERMLITHALFALGWACAGRVPRLQAPQLATAFTLLAAARLVWFDLLLHNPALTDQWVGPLPLLNLILPAYVGAAAWLAAARGRAGRLAGLWLWLSLAALVAATMLLVRQGFQGAILAQADMPRAEFYGYSLAGLLLSIALLWAGVRRRDTPVRVAGLALLTATVLKVFLIDAAALEGLLRILSFLGLGVALIGVGKLYATVLMAEREQ